MFTDEKKALEELVKWEDEYITKKVNNPITKSLKKVDDAIKPVTKPISDGVNAILDNEMILRTQKTLQEAIAGAFHFTHDNIKYTYNKEYVLKELQLDTLEDLGRVYSGEIESCVNKITNENKLASAAEGFGFGLGGIEATLAEIPVFIALTVRVQQQICACYGYNPESEFEQSFMLKAMSFSSLTSVAGKSELQFELNALRVAIKRHTYKELKEMGGKYTLPEIAKTFAKQQGKSLSKKKMAQGIYIIGGVIGGFFNYNHIHKIAMVTNKLYKRRFIEDKLDLLE